MMTQSVPGSRRGESAFSMSRTICLRLLRPVRASRETSWVSEFRYMTRAEMVMPQHAHGRKGAKYWITPQMAGGTGKSARAMWRSRSEKCSSAMARLSAMALQSRT